MATARRDVELDPQVANELLEEIANHELPEPLASMVSEYQELRDSRSPFVFQWLHHLLPENQLSCVEARYVEKVGTDKVLTILFITLLDDAIEKHDNRRTFHELAKIAYPERPVDIAAQGIDPTYVGFGERLWSVLHDRLQQAPNYDTYIDLYRYDLGQVIASIDFSSLTNRHPNLATLTDLERSEAHNMGLLTYSDIDLMHATSTYHEDLSTIREAVLTAQLMARIANWVTTWERELYEGDFSSGPVVYALEQGIITADELRRVRTDPEMAEYVIQQINDHDIEERFLEKWDQQYRQLERYDDRVSAMDMSAYIEGTTQILRYHLVGRGLI